MTNPAKDSIYSGVVGLRSLRIISFLAELNGLELMAADVGNAYLEACTKEKLCFIAGPEFGALAGHTFVDANLMHDFTTGQSATGVLHLLNQTPIDWFSKRQGQVETATYGSEFVAAHTSVEQIINLCYTLRMFGVPLDGPSWLFGDNQSVITSSTLPHSTLSKRWNTLFYHHVCEAIAARILRFHFIDSKQNPSDIMTKPLEHATAWPHIDTLLFRKGETIPHDVDPTQDTLRGVTNSQGALG